MRIPSKVSTRTDELSGGGHRIRLHSRQGGQVPWIGRISPHSAAGSSFPSPWCDSCSTPGNLEPHPMRRSRPIEKDYAFEIPTAQERMRRTTCLRADVVIRQGKGPRQALTGCKCTRTFCAREPTDWAQLRLPTKGISPQFKDIISTSGSRAMHNRVRSVVPAAIPEKS